MQPKEGSTKQCKGIITERNRYFTGKYMTKRDFEHEQTYFLNRRQLHNRLLHGTGIVCGLNVEHHPDKVRNLDTDCARRWVVVRAGIAIDCCGRELVLEKDILFELPLPEQETKTGNDQPPQEVMYDSFLLVLRYTEEEIEHVPAIYNEGPSDRLEANRVREVARVDVVSLNEVEAGCWQAPSGGTDPNWPIWVTADCGQGAGGCGQSDPDTLPGPAGICLEPQCPCHGVVPLARIDFDPDYLEAGFKIDLSGRNTLPISKEYLTHIVNINWPHGGYMTIADLRERNGRLEVCFDREIMLPPAERGEGIGINEHTMKVQFMEPDNEELQNLKFPRNRPKLENGSMAVFTINPDDVSDTIDAATIYITLYCDFILDQYGNPVDGDHLRGQLPSGNGHPGGIFRSWFRIIDDASPAIALSISGATTARPGGTIPLLLNLTNRGATNLSNITLVKNPGGDDQETLELDCPKQLGGGLSAGCLYYLSIPDNATSPYIVVIQARAEGEGRSAPLDSSQHVIHLDGADQTLEVTKHLEEVERGKNSTTLTYKIVVKNNGAKDLKDVVLVDRYWIKGGQAHFERRGSDAPQSQEGGRRLSWRWSELERESQKTVTAKIRVDFSQETADIINCARVSAEISGGARISDSHKLRRTISQTAEDRDR